MSVNSAGLRRKFRQLPQVVNDALTKQVEKEASKLVAEMRFLAPVPGLEIAWTWGDAPRGAVVVRQVRNRERADLSVTIYARGRSVDARWFEFGTNERVQATTGRRTGRIVAQPFFFPPYRANRQRIRNNIRAALRRAVKKL
jgi:hypothetical protein